MDKPYGPFFLFAATHTEDFPVRIVRIKVLGPGQVEVTDLENNEVPVEVAGEGAQLVIEGKHFNMYIGNRRVTLGATRAGIDVTLAEPIVFGPLTVPEARRLPHIKYEPFMSCMPCDKRFNKGRNGQKYGLYRENVDPNELDSLRKRVAELEAELSTRSVPKNAVPTPPAKGKQVPQVPVKESATAGT